MKAGLYILTVLAFCCLGVLLAPTQCNAASASLVVLSTNPNGVPTTGNQYLLGLQVTGISGPTFLGAQSVDFTGSLGADDAALAFAAQPVNFYHGPRVLFQSEADFANTFDPADYVRKNDSYFASPWRTGIPSPNGAGESAGSLSLDGGLYGPNPALIPTNGIYPFAYINVTSSAGVEIQGEFALGAQSIVIGDGDGLRLTLDGALVAPGPDGVPGDYNADLTVDAADYVLWRSGGSLENEGVTDGTNEPGDYDFWQSQFGANTEGGGSDGTVPAAIPEPSTLGLLALAFGCNPRLQSGGWQRSYGNS